MKVEITQGASGQLVKIDVSNAFARKAGVIGRTKQHIFAMAMSSLIGLNGEILYVVDKRGVSSRGFYAVVRVDE